MDKDWTLAWLYYASAVCAFHGEQDVVSSVRKGSRTIALPTNSDPDPTGVFDADQEPRSNGYPPLIDELRKYGKESGNQLFDWNVLWDPDVKLRIRRWTDPANSNSILTPEAFYLRWPYDDDTTIPMLNQSTEIPDRAHYFFSPAFMRALDEVVATLEGRALFSRDRRWDGRPPFTNDVAMDKIITVTYARDPKLRGIPEGLEVRVEEGRGTTSTYWEFDGHFILHLGWDWESSDLPPNSEIGDVPGEDAAAPQAVDAQHTDVQDASDRIAEWPCGALGI